MTDSVKKKTMLFVVFVYITFILLTMKAQKNHLYYIQYLYPIFYLTKNICLNINFFLIAQMF